MRGKTSAAMRLLDSSLNRRTISISIAWNRSSCVMNDISTSIW